MAYFEAKSIRDITADDIRQLVTTGVQEHLFLEYKEALYTENDRGRKEFLLDVCMFANGQSGHLLIGIPEQRADDGQPTGAPDPNAELGVEVENPEATLQSYDARVLATIEERLPMQSAAVAMGNGRYVFVFRVSDSLFKPHCVRYQGHVYFPSRRERQRYEMDVREIKELSMRAATQIEQADSLLCDSTHRPGGELRNPPVLVMAMVPIFFREFLLDLRSRALVQAVGNFDIYELAAHGYRDPYYNFNGLQRPLHERAETVTLFRSGLLVLRTELAAVTANMPGRLSIYPTAIDLLLRGFMTRAQQVYAAAEINSPMLLRIALHARAPIVALYPDRDPVLYERQVYEYPTLQVQQLQDTVEKIIRPLCDHVHQTFGRASSPCFADDGEWVDPRRVGAWPFPAM